MKRTLTALALVGVLGQGCSPRHFLKEMYTVSELDHLVMNNQKGLVTYVKKSEEDGLRDLHRLVKESPLEDAWVYIPEDKEWWEVGRYSWEEKSFSKASLNGTLVEILAGTSTEAIKYHIHPEKGIRSLFSKISGDNDWDVFLTLTSLPSSFDLYASLAISCSVREQAPGKKIRFKIAAPQGIIEYTPRQEAVDRICSEDGDRRRDLLANAITPIFDVYNVQHKMMGTTSFHPGPSTLLYGDDNFEIRFMRYPE